MRANQSTLIATARQHGSATASTWSANRYGDRVAVYHYTTHMLDVYEDNTVIRRSHGWGSQTDKQGVGKIIKAHTTMNWRDIPEDIHPRFRGI